jgi:hypothetical protein
MNKNKTRAKARGKRRVKSAPVKFVQIAVVPATVMSPRLSAPVLFIALDTEGRVFWYENSPYAQDGWFRLTNDDVRVDR